MGQRDRADADGAAGHPAVAIFEEIRRRHPEIGPGVRRTLERRIRAWRAVNGPEQDVIFRQEHPPVGSAFPISPTWASSASASLGSRSIIGSTISGWRSPASSTDMSSLAARASLRWRRACRTRCGHWGCAAQHRSDSLSAAFRNLDRDAQEDLTRRYEELCAHYGMMPTRNNPGVAHENGSIESPHGHLKKAIEDALLLRGSRNFEDLAAYRRFVDEVVGRRNARNRKRIDIERAAPKPLPERRTDRLRGGARHRHLQRRLHLAQGVLSPRPRA